MSKRGLAQLFSISCVSFLIVSSLVIVKIPGEVSAFPNHDEIHIVGDSEFNATNGVTGGNGTAANPYIIEGWNITSVSGLAIWIRNTQAHFVIRNVTLLDGHIEIAGCSNGRILNTNITQSFGSAIALWTCSNMEVSGCRLTTGEYGGAGVWASNCTNVTISRCHMDLCYWGVMATDFCSYISVTGNHISNGTDYHGLISDGTQHLTVNGNEFFSAGIGVLGSQISCYQTLSVDPYNTVNGRPVLFFKGLTDVNVDGIPVGQIIAVMCTGVRASNISFTDTYSGFIGAYSTPIRIENCTFSNGDTGILLYECVAVSLIRNYLIDCIAYGILAQVCTNFVATFNELTSTDPFRLGQAILIAYSSGLDFNANRISRMHDGIMLWDCQDVDEWHNAMVNMSASGIQLADCTNVRITDNLLTSCAEWGAPDSSLEIYRSSMVRVAGNSFVDNVAQVTLDSSFDIDWNDSYPDGGNYWSVWFWDDLMHGPSQNLSGSDGICDLPYQVNATMRDYYPLRASTISNLAPLASFVLSSDTGTTLTSFEVNSSSSWDFEDGNDLLAIWDWEGDGTWDTHWQPLGAVEHAYPSSGNYTIHLMVRDSQGLTGNATMQVEVIEPAVPEFTTPLVPVLSLFFVLAIFCAKKRGQRNRTE